MRVGEAIRNTAVLLLVAANAVAADFSEFFSPGFAVPAGPAAHSLRGRVNSYSYPGIGLADTRAFLTALSAMPVIDLGMICPGPIADRPGFLQPETGWTFYKVKMRQPEAEIIFSRVSPAVLVRAKSKTVTLFHKARAVLVNSYGRRNEEVKKLKEFLRARGLSFEESGERGDALFSYDIVPAYVAMPAADGVAVLGPDELEDGNSDNAALGDTWTMSESWLLAWFGECAHIMAADTPVGMRHSLDHAHGYGGRFDRPFLVVLQHEPQRIALDANGLTLGFREAAGDVALMPIDGLRNYERQETERWAKEGLPDEIVEKCSQWARRLKYYPASAKESFRVSDDGNTIEIKEEFDFIEIQDAWETKGEKLAPIPGMMGLALAGPFPADFMAGGKMVEPLDTGYLAPCGLYQGIPGADSYVASIGIGKYAWETPACPAAQPDASNALKARLEEEVKKMVAAGHLAPCLLSVTRFQWHMGFWWVSPCETAAALGPAMPFLPDDLKREAMAYLKAEMESQPLFDINPEQYRLGARREPYQVPLDDLMAAGDYYEKYLAAEMEFRRNRAFFRDLYGLAWYMKATGDSGFAGENCDDITAVFEQPLALFDWSLGGPRRGNSPKSFSFDNGDHRFAKGVACYNQLLKGALGYARVMSGLGRRAERDMGLYVFARLSASRAGMARLMNRFETDGLLEITPADINCVTHIDEHMLLLGDGRIGYEDQEFPSFVDLVPEIGRLLADCALPETLGLLDRLDGNKTLWFQAMGEPLCCGESRTSPLDFYYGNFQAMAWAAGKRGSDLTRYLDRSPFLGDLYYIENLAAALRCQAEPVWEKW